MLPRLLKRIASKLLCGAALVGVANLAAAQEYPLPPSPPTTESVPQEDLKGRLDRLEKQNEVLQQALQALQAQQPPLGRLGAPITAEAEAGLNKDQVTDIVANYLKAQAEKKTAGGDKKSEWHEVGSDLKLSASWKDGVYFQTSNKDFWSHIGGWAQYDNVWWSQDKGLRVVPGAIPKGKSQPATGGIGPLTDGDLWRRLRLQFEGGFWEVFEYNLIPAFENDQFGTIGLDEFWFGISKLPIIGNVRIGHVKMEHNLEGDGISSSRTMTWLERSSMGEAFYTQNFCTGLWAFNSFMDDRVTLGGNFGRQDGALQSSGADFGDGEYTWAGRVTALPLYMNEGRALVHVGASYTWYKAQTGFDASGFPTGVHAVRYRARPEMRDAVPAGVLVDASSVNTIGGNKNRLVDTGTLTAENSSVLGLEFLGIWGPLSVQAEYSWCTVNGVTAPVTGDFTFSGGYVQAAYLLTGENRSYDKRLGRLDSYYLGRKGPNTPFWLVRDEDGRWNSGLGAWELAARWSYLDLNDRAVHGGKEEGLSLGLNWIMNNNFKMTFQYQWNDRYSLPVGINPGSTSGFGVRAQLVF